MNLALKTSPKEKKERKAHLQTRKRALHAGMHRNKKKGIQELILMRHVTPGGGKPFKLEFGHPSGALPDGWKNHFIFRPRNLVTSTPEFN